MGKPEWHSAVTCIVCEMRCRAIRLPAGFACMDCIADAVAMKMDRMAGEMLAAQNREETSE